MAQLLPNSPLTSLATILGSLVLARWSYKLARNLKFFLRTSNINRYLENSSGKGGEPWALITGSGSGLGRALAFDLASRGFNIVLHGSNASKLETVKKELQAVHPARSIRTLQFDAALLTIQGSNSSSDEKELLATKLDAVAASLSDINLRILINNVGMPQARPAVRPPFDAIDTFTYEELLHNASGNALFPFLLTRALYPLLLRNQPCLILNICSWISRGIPLAPSYGPAKAFLMASSKELRLENRIAMRSRDEKEKDKKRDIEVLGIDVLGFTGSDTIHDPPNLLIPDARTFSKAVLRSVGCGEAIVTPWLPHAVFLSVLDALPNMIREWVVSEMILGTRKEYAEKLRSGSLSGMGKEDEQEKKKSV